MTLLIKRIELFLEDLRTLSLKHQIKIDVGSCDTMIEDIEGQPEEVNYCYWINKGQHGCKDAIFLET